jgi:hypothetical protein
MGQFAHSHAGDKKKSHPEPTSIKKNTEKRPH